MIIQGAQERFFQRGQLQVSSYTGEYVVDEEKGHVRFLTSGILKVNYPAMIDAFLVGGGGSAAYYGSGSNRTKTCGGGSGYTFTGRGIELIPGAPYEITVGEGGKASRSSGNTGYAPEKGGNGEDTVAFGVTAHGGEGGDTNVGGDGGSGGGGMSNSFDNPPSGGEDGEDGVSVYIPTSYRAGVGQHSTTRAFGEEDGELFATGGHGGYVISATASMKRSPEDGAPNTGNGGDGAIDRGGAFYGGNRSGGSGIVIIREAVS